MYHVNLWDHQVFFIFFFFFPFSNVNLSYIKLSSDSFKVMEKM